MGSFLISPFHSRHFFTLISFTNIPQTTPPKLPNNRPRKIPHPREPPSGEHPHHRPRTSSPLGLFAALSLLFCNLDAADARVSVSDPSATFSCENVESYYSGVEGLEGDRLMMRLHSIVSGHRYLHYNEVWDALEFLDAADVDNSNASSEVIEIYSQKAVPKVLAGKLEGWNREHLWPRSYGLTDSPSLTDLHNIRPADTNVNSSRGNKYYGECLSESDCLRPANVEAAFDTETDKYRWMPPLQVRGDIARSIMYMAVRYGSLQPIGSLHLHLSDSPNSSNQEMGLLSILLKWNEIDPPSREEMLRNDRVCTMYQHNRNPFVDHPEYGKLIWKNSFSKHQEEQIAFRKKAEQSSSFNSWINEFHYDNNAIDQNEFIEIVTGPEVNAAEIQIVLYNGVNGKMYRSLSLKNQIFSSTKISMNYVIHTAYTRLQDGPSDGIALVSVKPGSQPEIIQFISYEGTMKATDGPAKGLESVDIKLQESKSSSEYDSIGLTGNIVGEFKWKKFIKAATPGKANLGQLF